LPQKQSLGKFLSHFTIASLLDRDSIEWGSRISIKNITNIYMVRKANPALLKPLNLSSELEAVVGKGPMPRSQVVKKIWEYIKKNDLQNPKNKRNILADAKLKTIFGGKSEVSMFEMTKLVSAHMK
jgi:upstream activation factor subunit UAF30